MAQDRITRSKFSKLVHKKKIKLSLVSMAKIYAAFIREIKKDKININECRMFKLLIVAYTTISPKQ